MREIKFRAWNVDDEIMLYSDFNAMGFYSLENAQEIAENTETVFMYHAYTGDKDFVLLQYTGLKDKNGKEIYEGDIVRGTYEEFSDYDHEEYTIEFASQVTFENGAFCIKRDYVNFEGRMRGPSINKHWDSEKVAVIGNAFENPELLEGTK